MANAEQVALLLRGAEVWNRWRVDNPEAEIDLSGAKLDGAELSSMDLHGADFSNASAKGAAFANSNLRKVSFVFADLDRTVFLFSDLRGVDMRGAKLRNASLEDANLRKANLSHTDLQGAVMAHADCKGIDLRSANLTGVNLTGADLESARVSSVTYDQNILSRTIGKTRLAPRQIWENMDDLVLDTTCRCRGVNASSCYGNQRFRIFLDDQAYLEELMESRAGRLILFVWWVFSNCGRSVMRWACWSVLFALIFAFVYWQMGTQHFHTSNLPFSFATMVYYSVVTFTTLGFGDVAPRTECAALLITTEVVIGYIMLGGLISIFSNKLARRSG